MENHRNLIIFLQKSPKIVICFSKIHENCKFVFKNPHNLSVFVLEITV